MTVSIDCSSSRVRACTRAPPDGCAGDRLHHLELFEVVEADGRPDLDRKCQLRLLLVASVEDQQVRVGAAQNRQVHSVVAKAVTGRRQPG